MVLRFRNHYPRSKGALSYTFNPPRHSSLRWIGAYEENVCYAELSDFFYVWLKRTAGYVFPNDFTAYLTEKDQEAIASTARFKNQAAKGKSAKTLAITDYQSKMSRIFAECRRVIKSDGIMTVMFNHKSTTAWDALTVALIEAGFSVTRTWPVKTEPEASIHIKGKAAPAPPYCWSVGHVTITRSHYLGTKWSNALREPSKTTSATTSAKLNSNL